MRRRFWLSCVFFVVLVTTVLGVAATVDRRQAEEREQQQQLVRAADLLRGVVDESLEELRAREDARPFDHYNEVYRPEGVLAASDAVAPSPLSRAPDDKRILGWFQYNPDKTLTLPAERSRPEIARRIRDAVTTPEFKPVRMLAQPPPGVAVAADVDVVDNVQQASLQEINRASAEVYKQLKEAEPEPWKRAALAADPKLPQVARVDIEWSPAELGNLGQKKKQPSQKTKQRQRAPELDAAVIPVDYTPMVVDTLGGVRVIHRVVSYGGGKTVQGVILDEEALRTTWLPGLLQRRAGVRLDDVAVIVASTSAATCGYRAPVSDVLDDLDLCFAPREGAVFPFAEVGLLVALFLLVVAALVVLDRAAQKSEALSKQKSAFISAISHELRTPLTTLRMHAELMRDGLVTDPVKQNRFHDDMVKESVRLGHLVENVLEAQRLEEGRRPLRLTDMDLGEAVADVASAQRGFSESRGFNITVDLPPDDVSLMGSFDRQALEQIIVNLVENAVKYARDAEDKTIAISVERRGELAAVVVADNGPGIPDDEREKVFARFHRVMRAGEEHIAGTGLGLALVRELARAHGGDARALPRSPGCSIEVTLPLEKRAPV